MKSSYYKCCGVPQCKSTTIKTPDKLFIYVPNNQTIRKKWLTLARRSDADCLSKSINGRMHFCEDHFDLPNDMENYMQYHVMGSVSQVRMKQGCMPTKFECQSDKKRRTYKRKERPSSKKQTKILIEEREKDMEERKVVTKSEETFSDSSERVDKAATETERFVRCSRCNDVITGFILACVQCGVRECGACDSLGVHAQHYVLRAPARSPEGEVEMMVNKVREELVKIGQLSTPEETVTKRNEFAIEIITEVKTEVEMEGEDPLENVDSGDLYPSNDNIDNTSAAGSQVVPDMKEIKSEPPDMVPTRKKEPSITSLPSTSRCEKTELDDDEPPPRKKRIVRTRPSHVNTANEGTLRTICVSPMQTPDLQLCSKSNVDTWPETHDYNVP